MQKTPREIALICCSRALAEGSLRVPGAASARHLHLCDADVATLFGKGYALTPQRTLSQPDQYACEEKVTVKCARSEMSFRVIGPTRSKTQVEISITDSYQLGIRPMVRMSGNISGSPGATLIGPVGAVKITEGVIVAARHMHISEEEAKSYGLKNGDVVCLKKDGDRQTIFGNVIVRAGPGHSLEAHFDTDEANAMMLQSGDVLEVIK